MTGEEFMFLSQSSSEPKKTEKENESSQKSQEKKYVYGMAGIARLFGCSIPTANRIKKSGVIDMAITQCGRKIIVDSELALSLLAKKNQGCQEHTKFTPNNAGND